MRGRLVIVVAMAVLMSAPLVAHHGSAAFENGKLEKFSEALKRRRSPTHREQLLAQVVASMAA